MTAHRFPSRARVWSIVALVLLLPASPVVASPPTEVAGTYEVTEVVVNSTKQAGQNLIIVDQTLFIDNFDALEGPSVAEVRCVIHQQTNHGTCQGFEEFRGSVDGRAGTLTFDLVFTIDGAFFEGRFIIIDGSGELANLHGVGTFEGGSIGTNALQFHFDP